MSSFHRPGWPTYAELEAKWSSVDAVSVSNQIRKNLTFEISFRVKRERKIIGEK